MTDEIARTGTGAPEVAPPFRVEVVVADDRLESLAGTASTGSPTAPVAEPLVGGAIAFDDGD